MAFLTENCQWTFQLYYQNFKSFSHGMIKDVWFLSFDPDPELNSLQT